jgi:hypothetical protein
MQAECHPIHMNKKKRHRVNPVPLHTPLWGTDVISSIGLSSKNVNQ